MPEIWETNPPLSGVVASQGVGDAAGSTIIDPNVDGTGTSIDARISDYMRFGVLNGTFSRGPTADPTGNIDPVNNPMPDWPGPTQLSGGAITGQWVADASSPSGHNRRVTLWPGAAGDEAYDETIVPITSTRMGAVADLVAGVIYQVTALAGVTAQINCQYLDASQVATGAAFTGSAVTIGAGANLINCRCFSTVTNAAFLRIRLHVARAAGTAAGTGVFDWTDVRRYGALSDHLFSTGVGMGDINFANDGTFYFYPDLSDTSKYATVTPSGGLTSGGQFIHRGLIFPSISAGQNNWAPTGWATCGAIYVNGNSASRIITGLSATGWVEGQVIYVFAYNLGAGNTLTLSDRSASSTTGNKFFCPAGANFVLQNHGGVAVMYSPTMDSDAPFCIMAKT